MPVDLTWGNTTGGVDFFNQFDLNHFAFSILGQNSQLPALPGLVKSKAQNQNKLKFPLASPPQVNSNLAVNFKLPSQALAGIRFRPTDYCQSGQHRFLYQQTIRLQSDHFPLSQTDWEIPVLPPLASYTVSFDL